MGAFTFLPTKPMIQASCEHILQIIIDKANFVRLPPSIIRLILMECAWCNWRTWLALEFLAPTGETTNGSYHWRNRRSLLVQEDQFSMRRKNHISSTIRQQWWRLQPRWGKDLPEALSQLTEANFIIQQPKWIALLSPHYSSWQECAFTLKTYLSNQSTSSQIALSAALHFPLWVTTQFMLLISSFMF